MFPHTRAPKWRACAQLGLGFTSLLCHLGRHACWSCELQCHSTALTCQSHPLSPQVRRSTYQDVLRLEDAAALLSVKGELSGASKPPWTLLLLTVSRQQAAPCFFLPAANQADTADASPLPLQPPTLRCPGLPDQRPPSHLHPPAAGAARRPRRRERPPVVAGQVPRGRPRSDAGQRDLLLPAVRVPHACLSFGGKPRA